MSGHSTYQPQSAFMKWMERRLPIAGLDAPVQQDRENANEQH